MSARTCSSLRRLMSRLRHRSPHFPGLLQAADPHRGPERVAGPAQRPDAAVHQRRDEPVQGRTSPARRKPPFARATTSQKCVRAGGKHNDLENVGRTARHHTFFEMLGNFSFGDYFKPDAIAFACELLTKRLRDRSEAPGLHASTRPTTRRARSGRRWPASPTTGSSALGDKDNFWAMGETGPCGPCSEIHYHQGDDIPCASRPRAASARGRPATATAGSRSGTWCSCSSSRSARATRRPLPKPSVDTGHGARAPVRRAAGRALELRDRPAAAAHRAGREALRQDVRPDRLRGDDASRCA